MDPYSEPPVPAATKPEIPSFDNPIYAVTNEDTEAVISADPTAENMNEISEIEMEDNSPSAAASDA